MTPQSGRERRGFPRKLDKLIAKMATVGTPGGVEFYDPMAARVGSEEWGKVPVVGMALRVVVRLVQHELSNGKVLFRVHRSVHEGSMAEAILKS